MEVGDYVRFKTLSKEIKIGKVIEIIEPDNSNEFIFNPTKKCNVYDLDNNEATVDDYIIKSSPNIIDLIEVGDYVNGQKVFDKLYDELNKCWYLKLEIGEVFGKYARTYQQHIKSILTKEQFESMEYKVD